MEPGFIYILIFDGYICQIRVRWPFKVRIRVTETSFWEIGSIASSETENAGLLYGVGVMHHGKLGEVGKI